MPVIHAWIAQLVRFRPTREGRVGPALPLELDR